MNYLDFLANKAQLKNGGGFAPKSLPDFLFPFQAHVVEPMKPRLLDLFCGAGGCAAGYVRAGFEVVGVDNRPQKNYLKSGASEFIQADALEFCREHGHEFDAIHASPPCQRFSSMRKGMWKDREHVDLVAPTREALIATALPYVVENVPGSPLRNPLVLCGTMFGLGTKEGAQLRRHRLFEHSFPIRGNLSCRHNGYAAIGVYGGGQHPQRRYVGQSPRNTPLPPATIGFYGKSGGSSNRDGISFYGTDKRREAMGIDWMTGAELSQAIPPAYTEFIGAALLEAVRNRAAIGA